MRHARDTFLKFLETELQPHSIELHNVRRDVNAPDGDLHRVNAVNVKFINVTPSVHIGETQVEVSVIHDDELTALDWVKKVHDALSAAFFTAKNDYTNPSAPIAVGNNIYWDTNLEFRSIQSDSYFDYRVVLTLKHKVDS